MRKALTFLLLLGASCVWLSPSASAVPMTTAFGPKQYTRATGAPQTFTDTFQHCGTAACQIVVINGNPDGTGRISSASIFLNGVLIAGPNNFNQQVGGFVKPVVLGDMNTLTVNLASKPGSFLIIRVECVASPANLILGPPGVNLLNSTTLLSAVPILNTGTASAENVQLNNITLPGGTLTVPASLPFGVGTIPAGGSFILNSDFTGAFTPLASYLLDLMGTYTAGGATYCFDLSTTLTIPPAAPGSAPKHTVVIDPIFVTGAPYPHQEPVFDEDVNDQKWTVPIAPFQPLGPPPGSTSVMPAPFGDPPAIVFDANSGLGFTNGLSGTAEPSGASGGGVIFVTANWRAAFSTDGGAHFTQLDPTTIFPNDALGFCCDQIVQYVSSVDRFFWLLQGANLGGYRLAMASPQQIINSNGTSWTYWNMPASVFGSCSGFDYPDMSVGNTQLYASWDAGFGGCSGGFQVVNTDLTGLQAAGTITVWFTDPADGSMAWGSHLMQDTGNELFWAGHNNNSNMRVFSSPDATPDNQFYYWRDVGISSWANNSPTSLTPDNQNWLAYLFDPAVQRFPGNAVIGGTRVGNDLWFAWSAGTDDNFAKPHIEMVRLDRSDNFAKREQVQIWNPDYAFAYPALATNICTAEVGLAFEYGGGGNYENSVVGFWGDFVAYITTGSNVGSARFGDYVSIRQAPVTDADPGNLFTAFGYGRNSVPPPGTGATSDVHYVLFGRPSSSCGVIE